MFDRNVDPLHLSTAAASVSYSLAGPAPVLSVTDGPAPVLTLFVEAPLGNSFLTGNADFLLRDDQFR